MNFDASGRARTLRAIISGVLGAAAMGAVAPTVHAQAALEEVVVTATRRETALQQTPVAVTAISGETLAEEKVFSAGDLASSVPAFSFTALTPLDAELNIRGITNTRLDSPTADPSVGTFLDGVYVGRTGDFSYDFFDLERVEVIRGPQGVLLGKNVVGGALNITTAAPEFERSGALLASYGNYDAILVNGHVTGGLTDTLAGRFAFQVRDRSGFAEDILHNRDVEDLSAWQVRGSLLWNGGDTGWTVRGTVDWMEDETSGINSVPVAGGITSCPTSYLRGNCTRPWSNLRQYLGITDERKNLATHPLYAGDAAQTEQFSERSGGGITLDVQKDFGGFAFNSLTSYRQGDSHQMYDQTGIGPEALGWSVPAWQAYVAWTDARFGPRVLPGGLDPINNGRYLFSNPVNEEVDGNSISQEFRLTSTDPSARLDWIGGVYFKRDEIEKTDRFWGENFLGVVLPGGNSPLSTLSGENRWINDGETTNIAGFGQVGWKFTDALKLSVGVRWTQDKKEGNVDAFVVRTGDRFAPTDPRPVVTIEGLCRRPDNSIVSPTPAACVAPNRWQYAAGTGFNTDYSETWDELTPQATLDWRIRDNVFTYFTVAKGFKGGGFDDTPANPLQVVTAYDPETVWNYEIGVKTDLLDDRIRLNAVVFYMDYKDLQITQTNQTCLCNLTDNASSAEIQGVEAEFQFAATEDLRLSLSGSYVDATYKDFLEVATIPGTNPPQRLDSSGNRLQRTPETQMSAGIDYTLDVGSFGRALNFRLNYSWQSDLYWATDNIASEPSYGLLDARIAFAPEDAPWSVALWGKNVTDELYRVNIIAFFGEEVSQFGAPRTYGVDFGWKF
jgi:iron complex outermembrane recepter protein